MRTIPVAKSIHLLNNISTFDEVTTLLQQAEEPFVIMVWNYKKFLTIFVNSIIIKNINVMSAK